MKQRLLTIVLATLIMQATQAQEIDRSYYQQKSRQQKTLGYVCAISGGATTLVGGYIWFMSPLAGLGGQSGSIERARRTGKTMVAVGGGLMALSIPLFLSSDKNKKKAELYVGTGPSIQLPDGTIQQASVGLRINL